MTKHIYHVEANYSKINSIQAEFQSDPVQTQTHQKM